MSSRVLPLGHPADTGPVIWKQVRPTYGPIGDGEAAQPDAAALREDCEQRVREAHAGGVREGEALGRKNAAAEMQPVLERVARSIDEMSQLRAQFRREAEGDMVRLSLAIARRVLRRELAIDPDAMHGLVLGALEKLQTQEICRVRVHPSHAAQITAYLQKAVSGSTVEVLADPAREPGTVIFETGAGNLDASVDSQLQEIERGLVDRLGKKG